MRIEQRLQLASYDSPNTSQSIKRIHELAHNHYKENTVTVRIFLIFA